MKKTPLDDKALFSSAEVAELMGWSPSYTAQYLCHAKVPCAHANKRLRLYSAAAIRTLMWRQNGRPRTKQNSPYLLSELITWFRKQQADIMPSDRQLAEDHMLEKRVRRIMRLPIEQRKSALKDLFKKTELAKRVVQLLD